MSCYHPPMVEDEVVFVHEHTFAQTRPIFDFPTESVPPIVFDLDDESDSGIDNSGDDDYDRSDVLDCPGTHARPIVLDDGNDDADRDYASYTNNNDEDVECLGSLVISMDSVSLPPGSSECDQVTLHGLVLRNGLTIQYPPTIDASDEDSSSNNLLCIKNIYISPDRRFFLQGLPLKPSPAFGGMLPRKSDEVAISMIVPESSEDPKLAVCSAIIPMPKVCWVRNIEFTNALQPCQAEINMAAGGIDRVYRADLGTLHCRWAVFKKIHEKTGRCAGLVIKRLLQQDLEGSKVSDDDLRDGWRHTNRQSGFYVRPADNKYTAADLFAGGGLISIGMHNAGLRPRFAVDCDEVAVETLKANKLHDAGGVRCMDIHQWLTQPRHARYRVDVLHFSCPCQAFSQNNTRGGRNDLKNIAANLCIGEGLSFHLPRIATIEQTNGLTFGKWRFELNKIIQEFTYMNYSIRLRVEDLSTFGNPQRRRRLIVIASCPGEPLPPMPEPTHGPGKLALRTANDIVRESAGYKAPVHMRRYRRWKEGRREKGWSLDGLVPSCIQASNLGSHWSGRRGLKLWEAALFMTVPTWYRFVGSTTEITRQIGNGVPPVFGTMLFSHIIRHLQDEDRQIARRLHARRIA